MLFFSDSSDEQALGFSACYNKISFQVSLSKSVHIKKTEPYIRKMFKAVHELVLVDMPEDSKPKLYYNKH